MQYNIKLTLSWNGANFSGYQTQPNATTVQGNLNAAWKILTQEVITINGCSRLDAGVHAYYFVLNFLTSQNLDPYKIVTALNGILHNQLKSQICIYNCEYVDRQFHARYHAVGKHYRYLIWQGYKTHALLTPSCWHLHSTKELLNLNSIMQQYLGQHDFAGFRASDCMAKQTLKHIYAIYVQTHKEFPQMIFVDIFGEGFLKNMVRNMVGTGVQMALGSLPSVAIQNAYVEKDRTKLGVCAPSHALTLMHVYYEKLEFLTACQQAPLP